MSYSTSVSTIRVIPRVHFGFGLCDVLVFGRGLTVLGLGLYMSNLVDGYEAIGSVPGSWCVRKDHKGSNYVH